jgi:hypothetical protein
MARRKFMDKVKGMLSTKEPEHEKLRELRSLLSQYKADKGDFDKRLVQNHDWYATRHFQYIKGDRDSEVKERPGGIEPVSNYLFSTLSSKHADLMGFYPESNFLPRTEDAEDLARRLTKSMPMIYDRAGFKREYNKSLWTLLKSGNLFWAATYDEANPKGDEICIRRVDPLRIYFDWNQTDIQKSESVIVWDEIPRSTFARKYGKETKGQSVSSTSVNRYANEKGHESSVIIYDAYYRDDNGNVQFLQWSGSDVLFDSTEYDEYKEDGYYQAGYYPIVHVQLFPEEQVPVGFGYVDVLKSPQTYVDRLDDAFLQNIARSSKQRVAVRFQEDPKFAEDYEDYSKDVVMYRGSGSLRDVMVPLQDRELSANAITYRDKKIRELKETSGTTEFARGESGGGVTAASAILALQESSNKISRDATDALYEGKKQLDRIIMGIIRQFYTEPHEFRVESDIARPRIEQQAAMAGEQNQVQEPFPGNQAFDFVKISAEDFGIDTQFDISIKPEKQSAYAKAAHNELAKELFNLQLFEPARADSALIALRMMEFDGKEDVLAQVAENASLYRQLQEMEELNAQLSEDVNAVSQMAVEMNDAVKATTGADLLNGTEEEPPPEDREPPERL